ncbi:MAG: hypothetical protein ACT4OD_01470 [Candidatus Nitrosotenuis sp.]
MLKLVAIFTISVLLSMTIITAMDSSHFAEAKKANSPDKHRHKISKWMGNTVCGDQLCEGQPYFKWNFKSRTFQSPYNTYTHQELLKVKGQ